MRNQNLNIINPLLLITGNYWTPGSREKVQNSPFLLKALRVLNNLGVPVTVIPAFAEHGLLSNAFLNCSYTEIACHINPDHTRTIFFAENE
jgi:hypothetical protein